MLTAFSKVNLQKIMSASLAGWLSGFVFLFCCGMMEAQAAETEFCPLAKTEKHCDKAKADENRTAFSNDSDSVFECCSFLPAVFDKVRKLEKTQQIAQPVDKIKIESAVFLPAVNHFQPPKIYRSSLFYKEKNHIKNCVLRI